MTANESQVSIFGLGTSWPEDMYSAEAFADVVRKHADESNVGVQKLLELIARSGIKSRPLVAPNHPAYAQLVTDPPKIDQIARVFEDKGVALAVDACQKALAEWGGSTRAITHTVAVSCTHSRSPGYDVDVADLLGLSPDIDCILLHGVACAGSVSLLSKAMQVINAATLKGRAARVLIFACELASLTLGLELQGTMDDINRAIGPAIFSDGAAALVLGNDISIRDGEEKPVYELLDTKKTRLIGSKEAISLELTPLGYKLHLSRSVPKVAVEALTSLLSQILPSFRDSSGTLGASKAGDNGVEDDGGNDEMKEVEVQEVEVHKSEAAENEENRGSCETGDEIMRTDALTDTVAIAATANPQETTAKLDNLKPTELDWALHPGGLAVINGVQESLGLSDNNLRATKHIYRKYGNTSSVAMLAVLDELRRNPMGDTEDGTAPNYRENVIACSFGPGMLCEMASLKRK